jgi:signal peptidase
LAALTGLPLTLVLVVAWLVLFRPVTLGGPAGYVIVSGHSMEPTFFTGDLAITQRQAEYRVGDIVAFSAEGGIVIHRIVGGDAERGYDVQGDNKERPDLWHPTPDHIVGNVWFFIPQAGSVLALIRQPAYLAALAAGTVFFVAFAGNHGGPAKPKPSERPLPPPIAAG